MYQFQSEVTPRPIDAVRCAESIESDAPTWIEPLTIDSARNPATPWLAAAIDVDSGECELLQELAHGISVDTSVLPPPRRERTDVAQWRGANGSLDALFSLMRPRVRSVMHHTSQD